MDKLKIKFEQLMAIILLICVMVIFFSIGDGDLKTQLAVGVLGAFTTGIGFIFGKMMPDKE